MSLCTFAGCANKKFSRLHCSGHHKQVQQGRALTPFRTVHDPVKYSSAHGRVRQLWGPAKQYPCIACGKKAANWAYDGSDPEQLFGENSASFNFYSRYPEFYKPMCNRCHSAEDQATGARELREYREWKMLTGEKDLSRAVVLGG